MSEYTEQAEKFLTDNNLNFRATLASTQTCPPWDDDKHVHGYKYRITISRKGESGRLAFDFWNSFSDSQNGKDPTAYDALSCIRSDAYTPEDFSEFCSEYGYDEDSRKAHKIFKLADKFGRRIRAFFSDEEIEQLSEIR